MDWMKVFTYFDFLIYIVIVLGVVIGIVVSVRGIVKINAVKELNGQRLHWYSYSPVLTGFYGICLMLFFGSFITAMHQTNIILRLALYLLMVISLLGALFFMIRAYRYRMVKIKNPKRKRGSGEPKL